MKNPKLTVRVVEDRLCKDEGAWLKVLGELGDMARMILELRSAVGALNHRVIELERRNKE